jgi:tripartite ATP-independent transporter DctM subunit
MSDMAVAGTGFAVMMALIALRMPVGLAMLTVGTVGYIHFTSFNAFVSYMKTAPFMLFNNYTLSVIPLFILMGAFAERSGLSTVLFTAARALIGHVRGGLAMAVIGACTAFGAICGSSVATTATFARAALPELRANSYERGFAAGTVAVGGTLGILIPPSVILVIYAISTEQNIAKLFQAALIPGLMAATFYIVMIFIVVRRRPQAGPAVAPAERAEKIAALKSIWPVVLVALIVVGGIYGGVFTPTEGAGVGCVAMFLIGLAQRRLGFAETRQALVQTAETSGMIFAILLGAEVFNAFLAFSQVTTKVATLISQSGWPPYGVLVAILAVYIVLGSLMDELAMILLTLPVFYPIIVALDFGMSPDDVGIWFGILVLIVVGMGLIHPPIGLNVFVVHGIHRDIPLTRIYAGVFPYLLADAIRLALVVAFPALALTMVRWLN